MLKRTSSESEPDWTRSLKDALRAGVLAMQDPLIAEQVERYFRDHPTYSRDAVHVAAVACRLVLERGETAGQMLHAARGVQP
jgi:hypothetical protein